MQIKASIINRFTGHDAPVYTLQKSKEPGCFYSAGGDKIVAQWDINSDNQGVIITNTTKTVFSLSVNKNILLTGLDDGSIYVLDLLQKEEIRNLKYHNAAVFDISISEKNNLMISCSGDGTAGFINASTFELLKKIEFGNFKIRCCCLSQDQSKAIIGCGNGTIAVINLYSLEIENIMHTHRPDFSVNALCFSPDGNYLLSGSRDAYLNIYDVKNNFSLLQKIPAHNYAIYKICYAPSAKIFATASRDKTIKIWNAETSEMLLRIDKEKLNGHANSVNTLLWQNENTLISAGDDRVVIAWNIKII